MLCGDWKTREAGIGLLRIYPTVDDDCWLNYGAALLSAVLFERMAEKGIPVIYKHFWNGQKVWRQEPKYMENPRGMAESFIVEKYRQIKLGDQSLLSGMFSGILPVCFTTIRDGDLYWRSNIVKEEDESRSISIFELSPGLENPNLGMVYQSLMRQIEKVNRFFEQLFSKDWVEMDRLELWFAVDEVQKVKLAAFDFQLSFRNVPIVLNYDFTEKLAYYPQVVNMKMFAADKSAFEVQQWNQNSKFMYWSLVNRLLQLKENLFADSANFEDTALRYIDSYYMLRRP